MFSTCTWNTYLPVLVLYIYRNIHGLFYYNTHTYTHEKYLYYILFLKYIICLMRRVINLRESKTEKLCVRIYCRPFLQQKGVFQFWIPVSDCEKWRWALNSHTERQNFSLTSCSHADLTQPSKTPIKPQEVHSCGHHPFFCRWAMALVVFPLRKFQIRGSHSAGEMYTLGCHLNSVCSPKTSAMS